MPTVSIILPIHNGKAYIRKAIESILSQTFKDFELIVVDDYSSDHTPILLEEFRVTDSRIKIITNKRNLRLPASLNIGHNAAKGKYLTWISDDNTLKKDFLEVLVDSLKTNNADVVYSNYNIIDENDVFKRTVEVRNNILLPFENCIGASFLYRKEVFQLIKYNENLHGIEDYDFWLRASSFFKFLKVPETLYEYRVHKDSLTSSIYDNECVKVDFSRKKRIVISNLIHLVGFSNESVNILLAFQNEINWKWDYFFKYYERFILDLKTWQSSVKNGSEDSMTKYLDNRLRIKLKDRAVRKEILRLFYERPKVILNSRFLAENKRILIYRLLTN